MVPSYIYIDSDYILKTAVYLALKVTCTTYKNIIWGWEMRARSRYSEPVELGLRYLGSDCTSIIYKIKRARSLSCMCLRYFHGNPFFTLELEHGDFAI